MPENDLFATSAAQHRTAFKPEPQKAEPAGEPLILTAISQNRKASRPSGGPVLE
jgi:hypothetical protein